MAAISQAQDTTSCFLEFRPKPGYAEDQVLADLHSALASSPIVHCYEHPPFPKPSEIGQEECKALTLVEKAKLSNLARTGKLPLESGYDVQVENEEDGLIANSHADAPSGMPSSHVYEASNAVTTDEASIRDLNIANKPWYIGQLPLPDEFSLENYDETYTELHKFGDIYSKSRSAPMSLFGGTIGTTGKKYQVDGVVIPRPNTACREGKSGYDVLQRPYVKQLAEAAEHNMIQYLLQHDPATLKKCQWFKENVPAELRVPSSHVYCTYCDLLVAWNVPEGRGRVNDHITTQNHQQNKACGGWEAFDIERLLEGKQKAVDVLHRQHGIEMGDDPSKFHCSACNESYNCKRRKPMKNRVHGYRTIFSTAAIPKHIKTWHGK